MTQQVDTLSQPILSGDTKVPLVVRVVTPRNAGTMLSSGPMEGGNTVSEYVLLSALPQDLRERVVMAIKAQLAF